MPLEIVTIQDLQQFKSSIIEELKAMFTKPVPKQEKMLKSTEVCRMLRISAGTLQNLRKNKTIVASKIGGTYYYLYDDICNMLPKKRGDSVPFFRH